MGGAQALGAPVAGWLGSKIPIKFVQLIGSIVIVFALFLMGPSLFFGGLPNEIWVIFIGLFLMGFSVAFMFVLVTPEIIDSMGSDLKFKWVAECEKEGLDERQTRRKVKKQWKIASGILSDHASALAEMSFATGSLIGPIVGGKLTDSTGSYRKMTDICCIAAIVAGLINFCVVFVPDFFMKKKKTLDLDD